MFGAVANTAGGAGSTVIVLDAVIVLLHASVNVQVSVYVPPHAVWEPVITPVAVPDISQTPVCPLVYANVVGAGADVPHGIVRLGAAANTAGGAGSTVIVLDAVIVRLHASVNVQVSVYVPPHAVCEPVITPVAVPDISHTPVCPFVYAREVPVGAAALHAIVMFCAVTNTAGG